MKKRPKTEITYKSQVTHLLLLLLQIADSDSQDSADYEEAYRKRLKFQKQTDWKRFRASVDLLDDTENAIRSAFEFQLGDQRNNNDDFGETYLRLYGVLNAVYLQIGAFKEIAKLLNYPFLKNLNKTFENLEIYKLRGMAGAHTVDYIYDAKTLKMQEGINKTTSFRIVQMHLEKTGKNIKLLDENNITYDYNLLQILTDYEKIATTILIDLIKHAVKTLVYQKDQKKLILESIEEYILNLLDYSALDKNKDFWEKEFRKINRKSKKYKNITISEVEEHFSRDISPDGAKLF
ncbi:MAG: hypothetical protein WC780_00395 [Lentimicrobiaceae bacterium]|jgi:hypothetical protein